MEDAVSVGYRSIDTVAMYYNEKGVGDAVRACGVPREELFITTKICDSCYTREETLRTARHSMKQLGLDYVDLMLIKIVNDAKVMPVVNQCETHVLYQQRKIASDMENTFVPNMETKIETTNTGGKVLAYDSDELVGRLDFSFKGNVLSIDHTYAYKEGIGVGSLLVSAINDYAVSKGLRVKPVCSFASVWYERHPQFGDILNSAI